MSGAGTPGARPRARIVATVGPATSTAAAVDALLEAGIDVARVNCAHGTPDALRATIALLCDRRARAGVPLAILADLAGPKLRIGRLQGGAAELTPGATLVLTTDGVPGDAARVPVDYASLTDDVKPGMRIFLNDGLLSLVVTAVRGREVDTRVEVGGTLTDRKGISLPDAGTSLPSLTDKDWRDLDVVLAAGVDWVGLSFVRAATDVALLRDGIAARGGAARVIAKIEKRQAVEDLDAVVATADAVMVARGDLGVECPIESVPVLQKRIIETCRRLGTPVITATQMLESMTSSPLPTRAEASDVANAVLDGTDAVMLSGETAMGRFPTDTVRTMRRIIVAAEAYAATRPAPDPAASGTPASAAATARGAVQAADACDAAAIVCLTQSGRSARALARLRPRQPLVAVTLDEAVQRRLSLVWGVEPVLVSDFGADFDHAVVRVGALLRERYGVEPGARVVVTAGLPFAARATTNTMRVETL
ncbi:MAG: pyruvate kinase [Deltaproteobacteria bacterium]|nr:pyruvate kinase [Deltaproteobacteria bacterium]